MPKPPRDFDEDERVWARHDPKHPEIVTATVTRRFITDRRIPSSGFAGLERRRDWPRLNAD
jgi:hypothetical protein